MIVECPSCMTRFRLDASRLSGSRARLKCSRCQHIFPPPGRGREDAREVEDEQAPQPRRRQRRGKAPEKPDQSLPFTFGNPDQRDGDEGVDPAVADDFSLDNENGEQTPTGEPRRIPPPLDTSAAGDDELPGDVVSLRPVVIFLGLVVIGYAILAGTLYANPSFTDGIIRDLPVGRSQGRRVNRKVLLIGVSGDYERTRAGKNIFVVTGQAINRADAALTSIEVEVRLLDGADQTLVKRIVFCGSTVPRKLLRDLTLAEVSVLGRLKPPRTFLLQPGKRSSFMAVFANPSSAVTILRTRVVAAQRQA